MDPWARWLLHGRSGGDEAAEQQTLNFLTPIRDRVLNGADIQPGDVVLDVGCGDGLLGFGSLSRVGHDGTVVFTDVSPDLLNECREIAERARVSHRCMFVRTPAETLEGIEDSSVDVVTTRSVLIYVDDKPAAFDAFRRVLRPGGRMSLFEPINRRHLELNRDTLFGYDVTPVMELAAKVRAVFEAVADPDGPMLGFDETDLLHVAEVSGLTDITVSLELTSTERPYFRDLSWETFLQMSPNPHAPTFGDAIKKALNDNESAVFESHLRPKVETSMGARVRNAHAYVTAREPEAAPEHTPASESPPHPSPWS
ncbi:class I SAM-dependent methyltransferase [Phytoactinopolyspora halophila]|uniref:class I SAM-dependent methyltransferase n=1 Tax=Phytoactinopolyspora halophila TaxID=1981511 RepID=UPI0013145E90|nr:class I SAM-dependent methyltransferase [Phytoactinopolyspora halophila]